MGHLGVYHCPPPLDLASVRDPHASLAAPVRNPCAWNAPWRKALPTGVRNSFSSAFSRLPAHQVPGFSGAHNNSGFPLHHQRSRFSGIRQNAGFSGIPAVTQDRQRQALPHVPVPSFQRPFSVSASVFISAAASFDLPPIDGDLTEALEEWGAEIDEDGVATTFGNDEKALQAAQNGVAIYNMTHYGRIRVTGDDRIRFLHNQTSADFQSLKSGQGCLTVFQTPTARTVDLALAWVMGNSIILTVSPSQRAKLLTTMDRYLFPADKVQLADITDKTCQLAVVGPASSQALERIGITGLEGAPLGTHAHFSVDGSPVTVAAGSGLSLPGYTFLLSADVAGRVWSSLADCGVVPLGERAWERLRVIQGRPAPGAELTDEYNSLEAGLWSTISTTKGCYMGQETIARLITYGGVKQNLWGLTFASAVAPGTVLLDAEGQKVGKVTSCVEGTEPGTFMGLGYIKKSSPPAQEGLEVYAEGVKGSLVEAPFLLRELPAAVAA